MNLSKTHLLTFLLLYGGLVSCSPPEQKLTKYYNLDSLLNRQVIKLAASEARLIKQISKELQTEGKSMKLDSGGWANEFRLLKDFNPAETKYVAAFEVNQTENETRYLLKPDTKGSLKEFSMVRDQDTVSIEAVYSEENSLYSQYQRMKLMVVADTLRFFRVEVSQNKFPNDTLSFVINSEIVFD